MYEEYEQMIALLTEKMGDEKWPVLDITSKREYCNCPHCKCGDNVGSHFLYDLEKLRGVDISNYDYKVYDLGLLSYIDDTIIFALETFFKNGNKIVVTTSSHKYSFDDNELKGINADSTEGRVVIEIKEEYHS